MFPKDGELKFKEERMSIRKGLRSLVAGATTVAAMLTFTACISGGNEGGNSGAETVR